MVVKVLPPELSTQVEVEVRTEGELLKTPGTKRAAPDDFGREFLDMIIAAKLVDGVDQAIAHIRKYGSQHTEAILTEKDETAEQFFNQLDSAILLRNASTQFADGGEFGMGAEIGIATGKLHARGPVGAERPQQGGDAAHQQGEGGIGRAAQPVPHAQAARRGGMRIAATG